MRRFRIHFRRTRDGFAGTLPGSYFSRGLATWKAHRLMRKHQGVIYFVRPVRS